MLHKEYNYKCSAEKKITNRESQGVCRQDELIGGKPASRKVTLTFTQWASFRDRYPAMSLHATVLVF
jgi:hypothetical protein